jgi:hypothetical protein
MNEINWNEKIGFLNDVDDMVEEFTKLFLDIARQCIPTNQVNQLVIIYIKKIGIQVARNHDIFVYLMS